MRRSSDALKSTRGPATDTTAPDAAASGNRSDRDSMPSDRPPGRWITASRHSCEDAVGLLPTVELVQHVGTDYEIELRVHRVRAAQLPESVHRVGCAAAHDLTVRHAEVRVVGHRQLHHAQAVGRRRDPLPRLEPGLAGRHEHHGFQSQRDPGRFRYQQVAQVRRVEGPAQDADPTV